MEVVCKHHAIYVSKKIVKVNTAAIAIPANYPENVRDFFILIYVSLLSALRHVHIVAIPALPPKM